MKILTPASLTLAAILTTTLSAGAAETPAVNTSGANNPNAPVAGANSYTEGQAQAQIESKGFTQVTGLKQDANGVWRGMAMKNGHNMHVSVDFQGNVVAN